MFLDEMPGKFRYPAPEDAEDEALLADIQRKGWHHLLLPAAMACPGIPSVWGIFSI